MRWLLFREAVITGYTKLTRSSYSWWDLSAMEHYFTNQPLPAPLAWFVETNPTWILRLFTATIVVFDVFVSFLFLVPIRQLQIFSFVFKFLMHANMMVSGNYGTYNILSIVLSFALLPPPPPPPSKKRKRDSFTCRKAASWAVTLAVLAVMCYGVWTVFGLHDGLKSLRIVIPRHAFVAYARRVMFYTIPISTLLFIFTIITAAFRALGARGCMNKMLDLSGVLLVSLLGIGLFVASLPPLSNLEDTGSVVLLPRSVHEISAALKPLHLANDYRYYHEHDSNVLMKTPAEGRSTLVLEGAMNENGPWKELSFYHVPDRLEKIPTIIPGHLPVVDLEVVLSGDKSFENSPILAILVYRILTKQKEVLQLIEPTGFIDGPKYIRIKKYTYQLTKSMSGKEWWQRRLQNIHLPPTHASTPRLTQLMDKLGITGKRRERPADATVISTSLDKIRAMVGQPHNLNGFYVVLVIVLLMNKLF
uniref:Lipase maturation factor n=1 Tax=Mesocestoides corti TaxID=53468 RepID=A0A5K3FKK6_MESCO